MQLLTGVLIVIAVYDLISKLRVRYLYDWKVIHLLFLVSILLAYYRFFTERYNYIYWICHISYVDVIYSFGFPDWRFNYCSNIIIDIVIITNL